ncbi:MAG: saccharopine dehydrogenase NADP-binding domain-containing protein [Spirochaetales bacterium]|nr:saccharopine dehydrogenase NADP-binding domain-containing protein [Spirochaetales bacterium]MCF7938299.1 saccharopine dehydrogenase NADP-binding domain-containing protein [Spirochaetales bacterium]
MKKIMVMGLGAQGSTIAKRLNEEPNVEEVICADYDRKAVDEMGKSLDKATPKQVNAKKLEDIVKAADGAELIVNALAPDFNMNVLDAAVKTGACYQDMASGPVGNEFVEAVKRIMARDDEFKKAGVSALINTGSAPGFANILTRESVDQLDSCDRIEIYVYDGIWSNKFIPFWWSPETAFGDMAAQPISYENGEFKLGNPFDNPVMMDFRGLGTRRMVDHEHEEPVTMGLLADKVLKGAKQVNFKYGGPGLEIAEYFYKMGLLSNNPVEVDGKEIIPMHLISKLTPPAPKYTDEIQEVIDQGMKSEEGAFLVRVEGKQNGRDVRIDSYANAPGLIDSFKMAGITHESYFTGQSAFLFTKMFVNNKISTTGVFPPEVLEAAERKYFFTEAAKLELTVDQFVERRLY